MHSFFGIDVIDAYTGGNFEEMDLDNDEWRGLVQLFRTEGGLGGFE